MPTRAPPMMKQTMAPMKKPMGHHLVSRDGRGAPGVECMIESEGPSARNFLMNKRSESKGMTS